MFILSKKRLKTKYGKTRKEKDINKWKINFKSYIETYGIAPKVSDNSYEDEVGLHVSCWVKIGTYRKYYSAVLDNPEDYPKKSFGRECSDLLYKTRKSIANKVNTVIRDSYLEGIDEVVISESINSDLYKPSIFFYRWLTWQLNDAGYKVKDNTLDIVDPKYIIIIGDD